MNILILSWRGPKHPHSGGAELVTHEHAKAWVKSGHIVTLFTSDFEGAKKNEIIDGIKIIRRGNQILSVQFQAFRWYLFENQEKFDLVIDQFHGLPFFTPLYVRSRKLGFIHEVTKDVWKYNPLPEPFHSVVSLIGQKGEPWIFKCFYKNIPFLTVSESTRQELIEIGISKKNIEIIQNGVKTQIPEIIVKKPIVTFLGAIAEDKGIEDALTVFSLLKNKKLHFWVIGKHDDDYFKKVSQLSKKLSLSGRIKFWGFVSEKKKIELLAQSLVVVNPSVREGWGLTVLEAASVGTPTVAYNVSGLKDAIINNQTGLLSEEKTPEALAALTEEILSNKTLYKKLQQNGIKRAGQFDWKKSTGLSLKFISRIVVDK